MKIDYKKQAEDFLRSCGVLFVATKAVPQLAPNWSKDGKHGTHYSIQLGKLKEKPSSTVTYWGDAKDNLIHCSKVIEFSFWNSLKAKEDAEYSYNRSDKPSAYDVLAGVYTPVTDFEDFCSNFGYDNDSRTAERTFKEVKELNAKIERTFKEVKELNAKIESIFTADELEKLQEIN